MSFALDSAGFARLKLGSVEKHVVAVAAASSWAKHSLDTLSKEAGGAWQSMAMGGMEFVAILAAWSHWM
jgi:hypothetical protein